MSGAMLNTSALLQASATPHSLRSTPPCECSPSSSSSSALLNRSPFHHLHASPSNRRIRVVEARLGGLGGGAGVLERPGLDQSQPAQEPRVEEGGDIGKLRESRKYGGGDRYRVLLLDHEKHTETQVVSVLPKVVPSLTPDEARACFRQSRDKGVGIVTVTVKEHAEFYAQMMARCGLRSTIEPDGDLI